MKPFDSYPGDRVSFLPTRKGSNSRHEYGLQLQRLTGQDSCAYCEFDLTADYYGWLLLNVDHVIPVSVCKRLDIPPDWAQSLSNQVLSCAGCNSYDNQFKMEDVEPRDSWTPAGFFDLRDRIFTIREQRIGSKREQEKAFFASKPWRLG